MFRRPPPRLSLVPAAAIAVAAGLALTPPAAAQTEGPSFDCKTARTPTQKAVCSDPELARLDRTVAAYYRAVRNMLPENSKLRTELAEAQQRWRRDRDGACRLQIGPKRTVVQLLPCLRKSYEERILALARYAHGYGERPGKRPPFISGWYRATQPGIGGRLMVLIWPDKRVTGAISTVRKNQGAHTCSLDMPAMSRKDNLLTHVDPKGPAKGCKLTVEITRGKAVVRADQCLRQHWCGAEGFMSGRYELEK